MTWQDKKALLLEYYQWIEEQPFAILDLDEEDRIDEFLLQKDYVTMEELENKETK